VNKFLNILRPISGRVNTFRRIFSSSDKLSYLKASLINTAFGISNMFVVYGFTTDKQLAIFWANIFGYFVSLISYNWVGFKRKSRPPYFNYAIVYGLSFSLNLTFTSLLMNLYDNFYLIQFFVVPIVAICQWAALNMWVFRRQ